jgi:hypothetical protein
MDAANCYSHARTILIAVLSLNQICDVLFATASMAMIAIHHCPWQADRRSAASLFLLALLVSPVSNGPTDAAVIILAILASVVILMGSWVHFSVGGACRRGAGGVHHEVELTVKQDPEEPAEEEGDDSSNRRAVGVASCEGAEDQESGAAGGQESELLLADSSSPSHLLTHTSTAPLGSLPSSFSALTIDNTRDEESMGSKSSGKEQLYSGVMGRRVIQDLWMTILALLMIVSAFVFYVNQNRTNYWISHGLWHACAMGSTYFFIRNRDSVARRLKSLACCSAASDGSTFRSL